MHDRVIRNGTVVDGTGSSARRADVAVDGDRITAVGDVPDPGHDELDASGRIVTPGFVDPHTHYDGQVSWDPLLTPSFWHGVTTVIMGNCGVGFAPVAPERRDFLIGLMEGVEDIPGSALSEGIHWEWESIPEYLDAIDRIPDAIDLTAQVTHGSVRAHVMGSAARPTSRRPSRTCRAWRSWSLRVCGRERSASPRTGSPCTRPWTGVRSPGRSRRRRSC